jgi:hypothetical protein
MGDAGRQDWQIGVGEKGVFFSNVSLHGKRQIFASVQA